MALLATEPVEALSDLMQHTDFQSSGALDLAHPRCPPFECHQKYFAMVTNAPGVVATLRDLVHHFEAFEGADVVDFEEEARGKAMQLSAGVFARLETTWKLAPFKWNRIVDPRTPQMWWRA